MMEVRHVQIGYNTVQVEVDPDDFKKPAFLHIAFLFAAMPMLAGGFYLIGWFLLCCAPLAWAAHRAAWKGRVNLAVREAAYQGVYRYER